MCFIVWSLIVFFVLLRLAPQDYHRWHMPMRAKIGKHLSCVAVSLSVSVSVIVCLFVAHIVLVVCRSSCSDFWSVLFSESTRRAKS